MGSALNAANVFSSLIAKEARDKIFDNVVPFRENVKRLLRVTVEMVLLMAPSVAGGREVASRVFRRE
jgi:hypothetical protein